MTAKQASLIQEAHWVGIVCDVQLWVLSLWSDPPYCGMSLVPLFMSDGRERTDDLLESFDQLLRVEEY